MVFVNIALEPSKDQSNHVTVTVVFDEKRVNLCMLSEKAGIYQVPTTIEITPGQSVVFEVRGKGSISMCGFTYKNNNAMECDEEQSE